MPRPLLQLWARVHLGAACDGPGQSLVRAVQAEAHQQLSWKASVFLLEKQRGVFFGKTDTQKKSCFPTTPALDQRTPPPPRLSCLQAAQEGGGSRAQSLPHRD